MAHLTWHDPRRGAQRLELDGEVLVGRNPHCQVMLTSGKTSRSHARLREREGAWWVEDLESTHGTHVNSELITEVALRDGDRIVVGDAVLVFSTGETATPSRMLTERSLDEAGLLRAFGTRFEDDQGDGHLVELVRFGDQLRRCTAPADIASAMLGRAVEMTSAERGLVVRTRDGDEEVLASAGQGDVRPSRTFVERVLQGQVGLVAVDTSADAQLAAAESVRHQHIRSIMCVPMWDGEQIFGYAYLDARVVAFRSRDLDLLMVIAYHAATEISRLELVEHLRREEEHRRRLLRFLPESVAGVLGSEGEGQDLSSLDERQVVLVHAETTGFSELAARTDALEVQHFLDSHLERLVSIAVDRHGGTLYRVTVSGIHLAFGAPVSRGIGADALAGLRSALAMRDAVEALRESDAAYAGVRLRIGVHTGLVVAGMMGPERRQEYSVVGAPVEDAGRVALSCPPGRVLATADCLELTPAGAFESVPAPERKVQLSTGAARCWWVVREVGSPSREG